MPRSLGRAWTASLTSIEEGRAETGVRNWTLSEPRKGSVPVEGGLVLQLPPMNQPRLNERKPGVTCTEETPPGDSREKAGKECHCYTFLQIVRRRRGGS